MEKHPLEGWVMLVCNPVSGSGAGPIRLSRVQRALEAAGIPYAAGTTRGRGDAIRLTRSAVMAGCAAVVAVGGDGTLFEVIHGLMNPDEVGAPLRGGVAAGLIQAGRGSDFGRSAGIPSDIDAACARLLAGRTET